jgi:hypothetical protein
VQIIKKKIKIKKKQFKNKNKKIKQNYTPPEQFPNSIWKV